MVENPFYSPHLPLITLTRARRLSVKLLFSRAPIAPDAAARRIRRKVGHSIWLGARQAAACRSRRAFLSVCEWFCPTPRLWLEASAGRCAAGRQSRTCARFRRAKSLRNARARSAPAFPARRDRTHGANPSCQSRRSTPSPHRSAVLRPVSSSCLPTENFAGRVPLFGDPSAPARSSKPVPTGSAAIPSIWLSSCSYSDCPFG